jgi:tetratricopeptide (TPR) repeat protein
MRLKAAAFVFVLSALASFFAVRAASEHRDEGALPSTAASRRSSVASQVQMLEAAVRARSGDTLALTQLASAYLQRARETGDPAYYGLAESAIDRALAGDADDVNALVVAGTVALAKHDFERALALGEQARARNPDVVGAYAVITDALVELGRYDEAAAAAQEMVDRRPDYASLSRASYVRELHGDLPGAIEAMEAAARAAAGTGYDEAWAHVIAGNLQLQQGNVGAAEAAYERAERALPGDPMTNAALARIAVARGDFPGAEALLRSAVEQRALPQYAIALGDVLAVQGRAREAEDQYALVRSIQQLFAASGVDTDIELALFDADRGVDPAGAYERALAAYDRRPSIYAADAVAWTAHRAGRPEEAQRYVREALRLGTRDPLLAYHAAVIARTAGDAPAAEAHLRAALAGEHALPLAHAQDARNALDAVKAEAANPAR